MIDLLPFLDNNPIDNLTKDQVKSIYVGETTSWSEVE